MALRMAARKSDEQLAAKTAEAAAEANRAAEASRLLESLRRDFNESSLKGVGPWIVNLCEAFKTCEASGLARLPSMGHRVAWVCRRWSKGAARSNASKSSSATKEDC